MAKEDKNMELNEKNLMDQIMSEDELDMVAGGAQFYLVKRLKFGPGYLHWVDQGDYDGNMDDLEKLAVQGKFDEIGKKTNMKPKGCIDDSGKAELMMDFATKRGIRVILVDIPEKKWDPPA